MWYLRDPIRKPNPRVHDLPADAAFGSAQSATAAVAALAAALADSWARGNYQKSHWLVLLHLD